MHPGDHVPDWLLRTQVSLSSRVSSRLRLGIGIIVALFAVVLVMVIAAAGVLGIVLDNLDLIAYAGLFLANWLGNGGALVPSRACGSSRF
jgi:hypothetical protein